MGKKTPGGGYLKRVQLFALLARAVARESRIEDILMAYAAHLPELLPFDRCSISVLTEDVRTSWELGRGRPVQEIGCKSSEGSWSLVTHVVETQTPVIRSDMRHGEQQFPEEADMRRRGTRSMIAYPLIIDHHAIGAIAVESVRARAYTDKDLPLMELIAAQIAIAIDRAKILVSQAERLAESSRQLISAGKMATVGQLATVLAHEVKNRFNVIQLGARFLKGMLERGDVSNIRTQDADTVLASIIGAVEQGNQLMMDFLRYARPQAPQLAPIVVHALLEDALRLARRPDVRVVLDLPEGLPPALGDLTQLGQVFINLILNAVDAMPRGGTLTVTARPAGTQIEIDIGDTGVGIDPANLPRLFQPFFTTKKNGTGLGLSISRTIIEKMGGTIRVRSAVGAGTTFTVVLPAAQTAAKAA